MCHAAGGPILPGYHMSTKFEWPMPAWLAQTPDVDRPQARTRFLLCLAAVYVAERGNQSKLARAIGSHIKTVLAAGDRGQVSPEMAIAIESVLGRELFPRELFRPDLFNIPAE